MKDLSLPNSVHVASLNTTLLSVGHICSQGKLVIFTENKAVIFNKKSLTVDDDEVALIGKRNKTTNLYEILKEKESATANMCSNVAVQRGSTTDINVLHTRLS